MGNCLKKTKVVEPNVVKDNVSELLSRGTPFAKPDGQQQADMVKDLKDEGNFETVVFFCFFFFVCFFFFLGGGGGGTILFTFM